MSFLFYTFYNFLLTLALPFAWIGAYFNDKLAGSLSGQKELSYQLDKFNNLRDSQDKPVVWLHAASAGEFEQIKPLLERFSKLDVYIFQTFTSPTIFYKVSQNKLFHGVSFLPWDTYPRVNRFIKTLRPTLFVNTRHDIWPNLLRALHHNQVRNILVNANLYEDSARLKPVFKGFNKAVFKYIDSIYTGSDQLKRLLEQVYSGSIHVVGDSRFDQVYERSLLNDSALISDRIIADQRVIVYGSVVGSDLEVVSSTIAKSLESLKYLHIIVPHEVMERDLVPWEVAFYRHKIKSIRLSEVDNFSGEKVIMWNQVGQLADLYKIADLAFIGAGFSTGVHSVTEAAIYNIPSAHGPKYDILAEAIELVNLGLSTVVSSSDDLAGFLLLPDAEISDRSIKIKSFIKERLGASDKILAAEYPLLDQP